MRRLSRIVAAVSLFSATPARGDCPPSSWGATMTAASQTTLRAALATSPATISVGEPFVVELRLCGSDRRIERLSLDATMPAHRHGMNYIPAIADLGDGRYHATGMLFHMPGRWEIAVSASDGATTERLTLKLDVR